MSKNILACLYRVSDSLLQSTQSNLSVAVERLSIVQGYPDLYGLIKYLLKWLETKISIPVL